ncbi:MAG: hypothetical protein LQ337_008089 [Flavoplaca oasis]|nr:MAG: hypothetical protein LQ337_008089 [Flavoplaca oasis]
MINEDKEHGFPHALDPSDPIDRIEEHASPTIPMVAGFTPINRYFSAAALGDTDPAPVSVSAANKGRKRQKKVSASATVTAKTTKTPRQRQPKKAKQAALPTKQNITHASPLSKPLGHEVPVQQKADHSDLLESTVQASVSAVTARPAQQSLQTSNIPPPTGGLGSTYQAAFRQQDPTLVPEENNEHIPSSFLPKEIVQRTPRSPFVQPAPIPASGWTEQFHLSDDRNSVITGLESVFHGAMASSTGLVPFHPGAMGQQYLLEPNPDHWDIVTPSRNRFTQVAPTEVEPTNTNDNYCDALDNSPFDDFLGSTEEDFTPMDLSDPPGQVAETICTVEQKVVPETLPKPLMALDTLSHLLESDPLQSPDDDDQLVGLSNSQHLFESSSPSLQSHSSYQIASNRKASSKRFTPDEHSSTDDMYDDEEMDIRFLELQSPPSAQVPPPSPPESPGEKLNTKSQQMPPDPITPATSPVKPAGPSSPSVVVSTPTSAEECPSPPKAIPHKVSFDDDGLAIPFIRPSFPEPIRDRSRVLGLSSRTVLRTCFRIGEALNAGSTALRTRKDAVVELYARVSSSERPAGSVKQYFQFADIFSSDKPPYLKGTYGLWKGVGIWDLDSKVFLGEKGKGKMARVVGRIGREETTRGLEMTVLSVWEVDWEDVGICKGHYCG